MKRLPNLDVLRLLLAVEVVYAHSFIASGIGQTLPKIPPVATFVCVSGYLIPASLAASRSWEHFAWKRALRIVPALLLSFLLVFSLAGWNALSGVIVCYLTAGILGTANSPLWSLMVEESLYTFHAVTRRIFTPWAAGICCTAVFVVWGIWWRDSVGNVPVIQFVPPFAAFFAGNLLYFARDEIAKGGWRLASLSAVALVAMYNIPAAPFGVPRLGLPSYELGAIGKCVSAVLLCLSLPQINLGKKRNGRNRQWVDLSYGIYVFHFPLLVAVQSRGYTDWSLFALTILLVTPIAAASWFGLESQALKLKNRPPWLVWPRRAWFRIRPV